MRLTYATHGYLALDIASILADEPDSQIIIMHVIEKESENHDLVIIGSTRESGLWRLVFGSTPEQIARRCSKTVIMAKAFTGIKSRLRKWLDG